MELRREHRKLSVAIVVALDRSGSMAMPVPGGRPKIELADLATAEVIDMLGPTDQFGCIAVDTIPHTIVPLSDVTNKAAMRSPVLRIDSGRRHLYLRGPRGGRPHDCSSQGGHEAHHPLLRRRRLRKSRATTSAGRKVREGGHYDQRRRPWHGEGLRRRLLKDIARRGGGQCMFTNMAQELPRLFAQDTFLVARSAFLEDPVAVRATGGLAAITRQALGDFPAIGGYNLCYLGRGESGRRLRRRVPGAGPGRVAGRPGTRAVLCGRGRRKVYRCDGRVEERRRLLHLAGPLDGRQAGELGRGVVADPGVEKRRLPRRAAPRPCPADEPFLRLPELTTLFARPGEAAVARTTPMQWSSADTLLGEVPLAGGQTALTTIAAPGMGQATLAPMCLPYSPEYLPAEAREGSRAWNASPARPAAASGWTWPAFGKTFPASGG